MREEVEKERGERGKGREGGNKSGLRHLLMSTVGGNLRKLNTGAQLQTFPYPAASKSFMYSNGRTNSDVQKRDGQTKTQRFSPPRRRVKSEPYQTWHGDRGLRTSSTFLHL